MQVTIPILKWPLLLCIWNPQRMKNNSIKKLKILTSRQKRPSWGKPPWLTICIKSARIFVEIFKNLQMTEVVVGLYTLHSFSLYLLLKVKYLILALAMFFYYRNSWIHSWRQISCNFQTPLLNWLDPTVESNWENFSDEYFWIKPNDDIAAVVISRKYILLRQLATQLTVEINFLTV